MRAPSSPDLAGLGNCRRRPSNSPHAVGSTGVVEHDGSTSPCLYLSVVAPSSAILAALVLVGPVMDCERNATAHTRTADASDCVKNERNRVNALSQAFRACFNYSAAPSNATGELAA